MKTGKTIQKLETTLQLLNGRNDPHSCWTIPAIVSYKLHLKNFFGDVFNGIQTHDLCKLVQCSRQLSYEATQTLCWAHVFPRKELMRVINASGVWLREELK